MGFVKTGQAFKRGHERKICPFCRTGELILGERACVNCQSKRKNVFHSSDQSDQLKQDERDDSIDERYYHYE